MRTRANDVSERMRTMHDGILVGVGTAIADDPRLNGEFEGELPGMRITRRTDV